MVRSRSSKSELHNRRRLNFNDSHKASRQQGSRQQASRQQCVTWNPIKIDLNNEIIGKMDTFGLPFEIKETINKYKLDNKLDNKLNNNTMEMNKIKEQKIHSKKLLTERVSIKKSTGYLLKQPRILNQIFAEFSDKCTPFKLNVSKPHNYSVVISALTKSNISKLRQYIIKHIENKTISIKCGNKKAAVVGCSGLNLKIIKNECNIQYIWEDNIIPGLIHIFDRNMTNLYKGFKKIKCLLDRTSILSLPIGQYGLLIINNAYWLDFIREHSNAFIIGLDLKPSELEKRIIEKSRLLISGHNQQITINATQMLYEFLKDTQQIEIKKIEFAHILGKHKRVIYAIINEVESKFIDNEKYKQYFESEEIEENKNEDPFWLEGLRLTIFPINGYMVHHLWIHGPPFMRNALKYYINSVILQRRKFLFTHATSFWVNCLFKYKQECQLIHIMLRKLFGVKIKLVNTQKHIKIDNISNEYHRLYDHETYLLLESVSRDNKLNVNGIRKYFDDLVENSIKIGLGQCAYLFQHNDSMRFWISMANQSNVSLIFDSQNKQIFIIGLNTNVKEYQNKLLQIIKKKVIHSPQDSPH